MTDHRNEQLMCWSLGGDHYGYGLLDVLEETLESASPEKRRELAQLAGEYLAKWPDALQLPFLDVLSVMAHPSSRVMEAYKSLSYKDSVMVIWVSNTELAIKIEPEISKTVVVDDLSRALKDRTGRRWEVVEEPGQPDRYVVLKAQIDADGTRPTRHFEELIALADEKHDQIRSALQRDVRLVRFEDGKLEIALEPGAPESLVDELSRKLEEWTGRPWEVVVVEIPAG